MAKTASIFFVYGTQRDLFFFFPACAAKVRNLFIDCGETCCATQKYVWRRAATRLRLVLHICVISRQMLCQRDGATAKRSPAVVGLYVHQGWTPTFRVNRAACETRNSLRWYCHLPNFSEILPEHDLDGDLSPVKQKACLLYTSPSPRDS